MVLRGVGSGSIIPELREPECTTEFSKLPLSHLFNRHEDGTRDTAGSETALSNW